MKHLLRVFTLAAGILACSIGQAQLTNGSFAPNFEATDINGDTHNLYEYLAMGYEVVIDVSATWCGPCWDYHTGGALEELYTEYGPNGTNEVMVIMIEGDDSTTSDDLIGTGTNTWGDWTEGVDYPIIDDAGWIANLLEISYYPTLYTVCADGRIYETGQVLAAEHYAFMQDMTCGPTDNDAAVTQYAGSTAACVAPFNASVELTNVGTEQLTSALVVMMGCDDCPIEMNWEGDLGNWESEILDFGDVNADSDVNLEFVIDADDDNTENNGLQASVAVGAVEATTWWNVSITTDCWPGETTWRVVDESGAVVESGGPYAEGLTDYDHNFGLPSTGCYTFQFFDAYGDGLNGSAYESCGVDGNASVWSATGAIWSTDGSNQFSMEQANADANTVGVDENAIAESLSIYPNPVRGNAMVSFELAVAQTVSLEVINLVGEQIMVLDYGTVMAGGFQEELDLNALASGVYLVNITAGNQVLTQRITVAK